MREGVDRRGFVLGAGAGLMLAGCAGGGGMAEMRGREPGETVVVDGVRVHYARMGAGPPVVLVHGASGNLNDMTFRLAPEVAKRHEAIVFDRPGHGLSGVPREGAESLSVQAALMRGALARMGIERAIVVGHSYGGSVALAWALDAPESVQGLLLLAAPSEVWEGGLGWSTDLLANPVSGPILAHTARHIVTKGWAESAATAVFAPQPVPAGYVEHLDMDLVLRPATLRVNALQLTALKEQVRAMVPRYGGLATRTEIVHGTADGAVPIEVHSEVLIGQVPNARLTKLEGVGHMLHQVATGDVMAALGRLDAG